MWVVKGSVWRELAGGAGAAEGVDGCEGEQRGRQAGDGEDDGDGEIGYRGVERGV